MNCEKCEELIVDYIDNDLSKSQQNSLFEHLKKCHSCCEFFEQSLIIDQGLQQILTSNMIERKTRAPKTFKNLAIACVALITISIGAWNIEPVKATIQEALNIKVANNFQTLDSKQETLNVKVIEENSEGQSITTYITNKGERTEYNNGNYTVHTKEASASYYKSLDVFLLEKPTNFESSVEKSIFEEMDSENIKSLGEDRFFDRKVEKYLISQEGQQESIELWFDKNTKLLLREISVVGGTKIEETKIKELSFGAVEDNKFSLKGPIGAKVIDARVPEKMTVDEKENYQKILSLFEPQ
ncbi:zf-HC2 domain-containing protein [Bacillus sp. CGMCC 1.16541]|uniref:zf-HC2 domain-containing protein n=1 Tax=Bacillus sp. CGMCC 1.16541 TaxID=2185143 RepID=UPI0013A5AE72|nr:zf-HC2 domain-containing protein [Bacillus sp. CGMCC 1.16541]